MQAPKALVVLVAASLAPVWMAVAGCSRADDSSTDARVRASLKRVAADARKSDYIEQGSLVEEPRRMAEPVRAYTARCLTKVGVRISKSDDDMRKIMRAAIKGHEVDAATCVSEGTLEAFPDIKSIPFSSPVVY